MEPVPPESQQLEVKEIKSVQIRGQKLQRNKKRGKPAGFLLSFSLLSTKTAGGRGGAKGWPAEAQFPWRTIDQY